MTYRFMKDTFPQHIVMSCNYCTAGPQQHPKRTGVGGAGVGAGGLCLVPAGASPAVARLVHDPLVFRWGVGVFVGVVGFASLFGLSEGTGGDRPVWFGLCVRFPDGPVGLCVVPGRRAGLGVCLGAGSRARACDGLADVWRNAVFG